MSINNNRNPELQGAEQIVDLAAAGSSGCGRTESQPRSPLDVVIARDRDESDWVSFPLFHAHLVMLGAEGADCTYGMRMRGADGRLRILHGPDGDLENVRRHVERKWLGFLYNCSTRPRYGEEDSAREMLWKLRPLEEEALSITPVDARSPFEAVTLKDEDIADLHRFPVGYPFIARTSNPQHWYPTIVMVRSNDLVFHELKEFTPFHGAAQEVIEWVLALKSFEYETDRPSYDRQVNALHQELCEERQIKPASILDDETSAAACPRPL